MKMNQLTEKMGNMAVSGKEKIVHVAEQVESVATLGFAGLAEDRTSKVIAGAGAVAVVVGVGLKWPLVAVAGIGAFSFGFAKGFKKALLTVQSEEV